MKVVFKKATLDDVEGIINLCNECFDETTNLEFAKQVFKKTGDDPNQIYIIGVLDNAIIAHTKLTIVPTMYEKMNTYSVINHFCVKKEYRRHNIATHMLEGISKISKDMGCTSIKLWSTNSRQPAHACYHNFGFNLIEAGFFEKDI